MNIQTGRGTIPLTTLLAIWSISMVVSLPGLAISPILGDLDTIFPHATHLEIQMLTALPSLLIIPFILLAGQLSMKRNKIPILFFGLGVFLLSGIGCLFATSMLELVIISCVLGIGAGMIIPLSNGFVADYFTGKQRIRQLGICSSISNITLALATSLTGWLADFNWHYPFLVYLLPLVPILLGRSLKNTQPPSETTTATTPAPSPIRSAHLWGLMGLYFFATYAVLPFNFNLPFFMQHYGMSDTASGVMISAFFLAIMLPGLFINGVIRVMRGYIVVGSLAAVMMGLLLPYLFHNIAGITFGCLLTGVGYGVIQPLIYEKAVQTTSRDRATLALALVMSVNYLAILVCPFIVTLFTALFHAKQAGFPFLLNGILTCVLLLLAIRSRKGFTFGADTLA